MFRNQDEQGPQGADKKNESVTVRVLQDQSNRVTSQVQNSQHVCGRWLIAMITLVDTFSSCWFGYCQGVFAGVLVSEDFQKQFPETDDAGVSGITTSSFFLGAFFGAIVAFLLGDKLGRKKTIMLGLALNAAGTVLQAAAFQLPQMIVGRVVNGLGIGLTSTMTPVFLSECAPSGMRGKLVLLGAVSNVSCFCIANWLTYGVYFPGGPIQWRLPLAFPMVFPLLICPLLAFVPETPRWLLMVGRDDEALAVIVRLEGHDARVDSPAVIAQYRSIKAAIRLEHDSRVPFSDVIMCRDKTQNFRRLILGCGTQFMQQFTGINALGFYLPTLLNQDVGFDPVMSRLLTAVSGTVYMVSAFSSLAIVDRMGRRNMMKYGAVLLGVTQVVAAVCLKIGQDDESKKKEMGNVAVAMFIMFHVFFGTTWGGTPWVYAAEVSSLGWRTRGAAAATATNWVMGFAVTQFTKAGIDNLQWAFYLIFAALCFCFCPIIYFFYPETANRTLEDMDHMFIENPSIFVCGKPAITDSKRPQEFVDAEAERVNQSERSSITLAV